MDRIRGCDDTWIRGLYQFAMPADLVFYLNLPIHLTMQRLHDARIEPSYFDAGMDLKLSQDLFESYRLFQGRMHNEYLAMAKKYDFQLIDATLKIPEQQQIIRKMLQTTIDLKEFKEGKH
jgi:dTMP kinase